METHEKFVISIDLRALDPSAGLDFRIVSYLDRVYFSVTSAQLDAASTFLTEHFNECSTFINVTALESLEDIITLLDRGAQRVFVTHHQLEALVKERRGVDLTRIVLSLDHNICHDNPNARSTEVQQALKAIVGINRVALHVQGDIDWDQFNPIFKHAGLDLEDYPERFVSVSHDTWENYLKAVKQCHIPIISACALTVEPKEHEDLIPAELLITTAVDARHGDAKSDDDLYPTVVVNELGVCLGLVYSNRQSVQESLRTGRGVYWSRKRGLWRKGDTSGDYQELISIGIDCDADALRFSVRQRGDGFCHLKTGTCFGPYTGFSRLQKTLRSRNENAPQGSYTRRLLDDPNLLQAKIMEEAAELCEAGSKDRIASEAGDLFYFAFAKCVAAGVSLEDIEHNLDLKSLRISRRKGNAKPQWAAKFDVVGSADDNQVSVLRNGSADSMPGHKNVEEAPPVLALKDDSSGLQDGRILMKRYDIGATSHGVIQDALKRPSQKSTDEIMKLVKPIVEDVRNGGDEALMQFTQKFDRVTSLSATVINAPFSPELMELPAETIAAIDTSFDNIRLFHAAQKETKPLEVETMPGVVCSRFSRPIEKVGLYIPGGSAVLPSTALMLGVPAMVAGCRTIVMASPPRSDGSLSREIVYIAHKVGAKSIVLAGGAQAVAAMAYGTENVTKVDKILGPGNQFVTAAKMIVSNDTNASVSIDMPAGPSEVLVIADKSADPAFVASDLLSQAEHGPDSQVVLIAVGLAERELLAIEDELDAQANALPRKDTVRRAIAHSLTLQVPHIRDALTLSNGYAPEHLILQVENAEEVVNLVEDAGSVFIGPWTPESVGDYSAGVNHSLPTYGYAKQYSGVSLSSFTKHITSSKLTKQGLRNVSSAVMQLAKVEELEAHRRAVEIRMSRMT